MGQNLIPGPGFGGAPVTFLLLVSFPDGLVPAETFIDPETFSDQDNATRAARVFIRDEKAIKVVIYSLSQDGTREIDRLTTVLV